MALFGLTGAVGRELLAALEVEHEGIGRFFGVSQGGASGQQLRWRGAPMAMVGPAELDPRLVDFALLAIPREGVAREAPRLLDAGARVIDLSGALAARPLPRALKEPAPLTWPTLACFRDLDLDLASALALPSAPSSTLAPLLEALVAAHALGALPRLTSLDATALVSASAAGRGGVEALSRQAVGLLNYRPVLDPRPFPGILAFNVVAPSPDEVVLWSDRVTAELLALVPGSAGLAVDIAPLWVPSFAGLALSLTLRFESPVSGEALRGVLSAHPELAFGMPGEGEGQIPEASDDLDPSADDEDPEDGADEPSEEPALPELAADAMSLRTILERGDVRVSTPIVSGHAARLVLMADPIERTAQAATTLLMRWMAALDAE